MFKKILVAVDGSGHAAKALDAASDLAAHYKAELFVLSVYRHHSALESTHSMVKGAEEIDPPDITLSRLAREIVDTAVKQAKGHGAQVMEGLVKRGPPARTIVHTAEELGVDAIVMGSRGLGDLEAHLLGSVSHKVTSLAKCTCVTVK